MPKIVRDCIICNKKFTAYEQRGRNKKYCSIECRDVGYRTGLRLVTWGKSISKSKMGHGWPEGFSERQSRAQKKRFRLNKQWNEGKYKGNKIGYHALHNWVRKELGEPKQCSKCNSRKNLQWANKSGKYKQEVDDWIRLCASCHVRYDGTINNLKYGRKN
jgi:hypothetical protein